MYCRRLPTVTSATSRSRFLGVLAVPIVATVLAVLTAALAAIAAHVAIDLLGDIVLPRDAYDGLAHRSRFLIFGGAAAGGIALALGALRLAFDEARGRAGFGDLAERCACIPTPKFFIAVSVTAVAMLAAMESLDTLLAGRAINDPGDLFGGSIPLALGTTIPIAALLAAAVHCALRAVSQWHGAIVRSIGAFFITLDPPALGSAPRSAPAAHRTVFASAPTLGCRAGKRGPPILVST